MLLHPVWCHFDTFLNINHWIVHNYLFNVDQLAPKTVCNFLATKDSNRWTGILSNNFCQIMISDSWNGSGCTCSWLQRWVNEIWKRNLWFCSKNLIGIKTFTCSYSSKVIWMVTFLGRTWVMFDWFFFFFLWNSLAETGDPDSNYKPPQTVA